MKTVLNLFTSTSKKKESNNVLFNRYKWQFALESSKIGIWEWNAKANIVRYSLESKKILGYEDNEQDLYQNDWGERIHPDDLEHVTEQLNAHLSNKTREYKSEHRKLCKDGTYKWIMDCGKIIERDKSGKPIRAIGTHTDITDRKENEDALSKNIDVITNQNSRLTNFAHIATHNLKEYAGNFESLLSFYEEAKNENEKKELISHLKTVSESLTNTISNLNDIVSNQSITKLDREIINLHSYIENTIKLLEIEIADRKAIITNNVDRDIFLYCNGAYLESIIQNLASNALKYSHPERIPTLEINSDMNEDGLLIVTVADNGIGIDLEKYGNDVFGLYRTFHGNENAEGVGLYITKNQVETLGGKISITSEVNVGTTFTITMHTQKNPA